MIQRRTIQFCLGLIAANCVSAQETLTLTRLNYEEQLGAGESTAINLPDYFARYPGDGPIVTFNYRVPEFDSVRTLEVGVIWQDSVYIPNGSNGTDEELITYKLQSGESYSHYFGPRPSEFVWNTRSVQYQLKPKDAPNTVANFLSYVLDGDYDRTIVHQNTSRESILGIPQGTSTTTIPAQIQRILLGAFRTTASADTEAILENIPAKRAVDTEPNLNPIAGSLSMERSSGSFASKTFFINLENNQNIFGKFYTTFAELVNEEDLSLLQELAKTEVWWLNQFWERGSGTFTAVPLYSPHYYDKDSLVTIDTLTVSEGTSEGLTYSWTYVEDDDEEAEGEEDSISPESHRPSFDISIENGALNIATLDKGLIAIEVTASWEDQTQSFTLDLLGLNENLYNYFPDLSIEPGSANVSGWYGTFTDLGFPWIKHSEHGSQALSTTSIGRTERWIYDGDFGWFYTTVSTYPRIYIAILDRWYVYAEGSNGYYFYDFPLATEDENDTEIGTWVTYYSIAEEILQIRSGS